MDRGNPMMLRMSIFDLPSGGVSPEEDRAAAGKEFGGNDEGTFTLRSSLIQLAKSFPKHSANWIGTFYIDGPPPWLRP
jgi:hypothetical protein